ncbi:ethanolamine ammonia-lyase reactivating factor EutA [Streptomyces sp. NPDC050560]|uniref:ethanolamine ammonia-lyase reactivating factor EutA n=1 Tax=Streptomyces sp. NPDC050560 TaxID=3365630 RepID=UPI00379E56E8
MHEELPPDPALLSGVEGIERHTLHSVGIDIGSATSHLVVSRLVIRRRGSALSAEFAVTGRETLHRSPVWLTPFTDGGTRIDTERLRALFEEAYRIAGVGPREMDTGAVVITGEALKKENAEPIARMIAAWSGRFICVSAGPHHEALLAAHGSGAVRLSEGGADGTGTGGACTVVNVDIGGGTTKVSVVSGGAVTHVRAFSVGARLLAFDTEGRIVRYEEPAGFLLARLGLTAGPGDVLGADDRARLGDLMARVVLDTLTGGTGTAELAPLLHVSTDGGELPAPSDVRYLVCSGGVAEYLGDRPPTGFGDLGADLGGALRARIAGSPFAAKLRPAAGPIRATVLGAGQFTVQAGGQTCYAPDSGALPVTGLRAVRVDFGARPGPGAVRTALRRHDLERWDGGLAAVVSLPGSPGYRALRAAADALAEVAGEQAPVPPLFVVLRQDLAHSLGTLLTEESGYRGPVLVVDGITVGDLDHLDIGPPLGVSGSLPVTVTSLEFPTPDIPDTPAAPAAPRPARQEPVGREPVDPKPVRQESPR